MHVILLKPNEHVREHNRFYPNLASTFITCHLFKLRFPVKNVGTFLWNNQLSVNYKQCKQICQLQNKNLSGKVQKNYTKL